MTPTETLTLRGLDIDRDAEKLARMWNASDNEWPGTWTHGAAWTAQTAREWQARQQAIETLIWDTGDEIAGYCSLWTRPEEANVHYVAILNVAPAYQGRSLARKSLVHCVERARDLGSRRLDLGTWSGNLKAVPLYKKCGFCWLPGTSVRMWNFMPAILALPCARSFFARHNWYTSFRRELDQSEDNETWEGMRVFTYRFAAGNERLTVWVDRESRAITAVETDDFVAAAIAADVEPPRGLPATLRWRLTNKRERPMQVTLIADGTPDLVLEHRATLQILPGETVTIEAPVQVSATMADVKADKPAPALRSLILIDGEVLELRTGLRPRAPVSIDTHPHYITLMPGVSRTVALQLRSHLKEAATATISIAPAPGLTSDWTEQRVELAAEGYSSLPITLNAATGGVFALPVATILEYNGERMNLPISPQMIFALPLGGVLGAKVDNKLRLENEHLRLIMDGEGSDLTISEPGSGAPLMTYEGYAAPPIKPSEYWYGSFDLNLEHTSDGVVATAAMASSEHPGFVLRKRLTVNAGPVFRLNYEFENLSNEQHRFMVYQETGGTGAPATLTLPLQAGVRQGPWDLFPGMTSGAFNRPENFAERWLAMEFPQATVGLIWGTDIEEIKWALSTRMYDCPPQSRACPDPIYCYVGNGGWRAVQRLYRRLAGQPATPADHAYPFLSARMEPAPLVVSGASTQATLLIEHLVERETSGTATLLLPEGWQADTTIFTFNAVNWQRPYQAALRFTATTPPGAYAGQIALHTTERDDNIALSLIQLGDGQPVMVRETSQARQPVLTIDNGRLELDVTPDFGGTVSAIREGGVNHLASPFPQAAAFSWVSPWYGGLTPLLIAPDEQLFPGNLWQEHFSAAPLAATDSRGIEWHGVRQWAVPAVEKLRGLVLELDTLTVGGSLVLKQLFRLINTTPVVRRVATAGWLVFVQPGGDSSQTVAWGPAQQLKPVEQLPWIGAGHWAAAQNPATGHTLALVASRPKAQLVSWGEDGNHLAMLTELEIPANGEVELVVYLALARDLEEARRYGALQGVV